MEKNNYKDLSLDELFHAKIVISDPDESIVDISKYRSYKLRCDDTLVTDYMKHYTYISDKLSHINPIEVIRPKVCCDIHTFIAATLTYFAINIEFHDFDIPYYIFGNAGTFKEKVTISRHSFESIAKNNIILCDAKSGINIRDIPRDQILIPKFSDIFDIYVLALFDAFENWLSKIITYTSFSPYILEIKINPPKFNEKTCDLYVSVAFSKFPIFKWGNSRDVLEQYIDSVIGNR
jgi:hypothetical protein